MHSVLEAGGDAAIELAPNYRNYIHGIEVAERALRKRCEEGKDFQAIDCPVEHKFTDGIYLRTITMPAGSVVIGEEHRTTHFNVCLKGHAEVMIDGVIEQIVAPQVFISVAGIRKVLYIFETCVWSTIHANPDNCTDIKELEKRFIVKP